jgi:hypothetical protein
MGRRKEEGLDIGKLMRQDNDILFDFFFLILGLDVGKINLFRVFIFFIFFLGTTYLGDLIMGK